MQEEAPMLSDKLWGSKVRIGQVWDGRRWKRLSKKKILEAKEVEERQPAEWEDQQVEGREY